MAMRHSQRTFYSWLRQQRDRQDPVGDLARDAISDEEFPRTGRRHMRPYTRAHLYRYLEKRNACSGALRAFALAYSEYEAATRAASPTFLN